MSDTTITRRSTPAQDAAVDYESTATDARRAVYEAVTLKYERTPAAAVKAEAKALSAQRYVGKIPTKEAAVQALAWNAWLESEEHKTEQRLQRAARKEDEIYASIDAAQVRYEHKRSEMTRDAANEHVRFRSLLETVANLHAAHTQMQLWQRVEYLITEGEFAPLDALEQVRKTVTEELTTPWANRATSRSSSVLSNLDEDIEREAKAEWLDWGRYL